MTIERMTCAEGWTITPGAFTVRYADHRSTAGLSPADGTMTTPPAVKPEGTTPEKTEVVVEPAPGEYDAQFARLTGIAAVVVAGVVGIIFTVILAKIEIPSAVVGGDQQVVGTVGQRTAALLAVALALIGVLLLIFGTWLAALETRGRLHTGVEPARTRAITAQGQPGAVGPLVTAAGEAAAKVIDSARGLRGTIGVLLCGVAVIIASTVIGARLADGPASPAGVPSSVAPTPSPTR
ncbi:hypothetical protein [Kribbella deserti]|uniref:Integral membrane protein n=1 Tax=Kribbella deserti TaxID=1926257 RepID=A0ABV6QKK2_9ACTN